MSDYDFPRPIRTSSRFTGLLVGTALGIYLLLIIGPTSSITNAAASCATWPACSVPTDPLSNTELMIMWGHRIAAVLVGLLVLLTTVIAIRSPVHRVVKYTLTAVSGLFIIQILIGGLIATSDGSGVIPGLHLGIGVIILSGVIFSLALELERTTGHDEETSILQQPSQSESETGNSPEQPSTHSPTLWTTVGAYFEMTKPRLMWLLCLVAAAGMALAAGPALDRYTIIATLSGGVLAIGAAGTFNHILERDTDKHMNRTADRPLSNERIPVHNALIFGIVLAAASMLAFLSINWLAAALGLVAIIFYSVVYTLILKPNSVQNTVLGGFAGALPAIIGWAAVTNEIGIPALALAGVIFLWTPAHFYNLALAYQDDYARAGFPMLPVVRGETVTRKHIIYYIGATFIGTIGLAWVTDLGMLYAATVVIFGSVFLIAAHRLHFEQSERAAFRTFHASNIFLGGLLLAVIIDVMTF